MEEIKRIETGNGEAVSIRRYMAHVYVMTENADGLTDWPMLYADGRIVLDHPEWFSRATIDAAKIELQNLTTHSTML